MALISVLSDGGLHLLFDCRELGIIGPDVHQHGGLAGCGGWRLPNHGSWKENHKI